MAIHGACGKEIPNGNNNGHCSACHEGFIGNASFEAHRVGEYPIRDCQIQPYINGFTSTGKSKYGHWQDDRGYWRFGKKLTAEEKAELFNR
ncbi:hypothetical protein D3C74_399220 [compost metagenome]